LITINISGAAENADLRRPIWPQLVGRQPAIPILVELPQGSRGIGDLAPVNHPIVIGIQGLHQG
jgi:hypothetical protein